MAGRHFRNEIAGLRAVAVISVVLFHLKIGGFQGGFVGVDVFVISGYLITRNILRDLSTDRFSLIRFYTGRARATTRWSRSSGPMRRRSMRSFGGFTTMRRSMTISIVRNRFRQPRTPSVSCSLRLNGPSGSLSQQAIACCFSRADRPRLLHQRSAPAAGAASSRGAGALPPDPEGSGRTRHRFDRSGACERQRQMARQGDGLAAGRLFLRQRVSRREGRYLALRQPYSSEHCRLGLHGEPKRERVSQVSRRKHGPPAVKLIPPDWRPAARRSRLGLRRPSSPPSAPR
jgi:hypothetical protein